jgi:hypothetical protein
MVDITSRSSTNELGEFRLPVGSEVLVAKAASDLEVAIKTRNHQELLVELRRLGQRVETTGVDPAGHKEVARAFGGAPPKDGSFDFQEAEVGHDAAQELR